MPTCRDCGHWERAKPYRWGNCRAPIPLVYEEADERPSTACMEDKDAGECELFLARKQEDSKDKRSADVVDLKQRAEDQRVERIKDDLIKKGF